MTLSDLSKLTPEEKRVRIAEAMGFEVLTVATPFKSGRPMGRKRPELNEGSTDWVLLPDYLNDLNAIAEAEKTLVDGDSIEYRLKLFRRNLFAICDTTPDGQRYIHGRNVGITHYCHATAAQRSDAFLLTI